MLTVLLIAATQVPQPVIVPEPIGSRTVNSGEGLLTWMAGEVRCDGGSALPVTLRRPWNALAWTGSAVQAVDFRFSIDASGRPHAIERAGSNYVTGADDLGPALAASRFAPGGERHGCTVSFTPQRYAFAEAPVTELMSYSVNQNGGSLPRAGWDRISPPGTSCIAEPRPVPLRTDFPDFRALPGTPGAKDWTMIGYDLDAGGRPVRLRTVTGTGNAALDRAGIEALGRSRFKPGGRTGCLYPFWRAPVTIAAPPSPDTDSLRPAGNTCPASGTWASMPPLRFPENYRRRSIEGWAIVAFDVAPWGQTGKVRALVSEPAADFGTAAVDLIRGATKPPSAGGGVGCVERVRFVMGTPERPAPEAPPPF